MLSSMKIKISLCFQLILGNLSFGFIYGPSLEYLTSNGAGDDLASFQKRTINLADYASTGYSVVVPLAVNQSIAQPTVVKPVGEFLVEAPENMRIMAVIQAMHFRTKSVTSAFPPVCRDFIRFGDESVNKVCGDVHKSDKKGTPSGMIGSGRGFLSHHNLLNVTVYTDVSTYIEKLMNRPNVIEISFTAYQNCPFYDPDEEFLNCLDNISPFAPSCVPSNLTCDGVVNCGFLTDGTFSKDEANCHVQQYPEYNNIPTTVIPLVQQSNLNPNVNPNSQANQSVASGFIPTTTTSTKPKTGFPSWWDWQSRHDRANDINSHFFAGKSNNPHHIPTDFSNIHFPTSETTIGFEQFAPYIALFIILWVLIVFAKISRCFFLGPKPSALANGMMSTSNLMQSSSSNSLSNSPTVRMDHIHHVPSPNYVVLPVNINEEPPPSYESLFKINTTSNPEVSSSTCNHTNINPLPEGDNSSK